MGTATFHSRRAHSARDSREETQILQTLGGEQHRDLTCVFSPLTRTVAHGRPRSGAPHTNTPGLARRLKGEAKNRNPLKDNASANAVLRAIAEDLGAIHHAADAIDDLLERLRVTAPAMTAGPPRSTTIFLEPL